MADEREFPAHATGAWPALAPDVPGDFPSEEEVERLASHGLGANATPLPAQAATAPDFSSEFPSEQNGNASAEAKKDFGAVLRAIAPPRPALPSQHSRITWIAIWIAAGCAMLAIAEGGLIARLTYFRSADPSRVTELFARQPAQTVTDGARGREPATSSLGSAPPVSSPTGTAAGPVALNPTTGQLEITSDPPGDRVVVDDQARGSTPVTILVSPGPHTVVVSDGTRTSRQTVNAVAGGTAVLLASFAPAAVSAGWLSIRSPLELQVREGDRLLGMTSADRLMMPTGRHVLDLSNADAAFQTSLTVVVEPGKTATSTVAIPNGSLSLNALPWASVTIDGQALPGTTPFANLEVPLGPHEIVWTHPQLGERRQTVMVNAKAPVRLVVDLRVK